MAGLGVGRLAVAACLLMSFGGVGGGMSLMAAGAAAAAECL